MPKYKPKPQWEGWPNGRPIHALPLGRLSQEDEDDKANSLTTQRKLCEGAIKRQGWALGPWEEDLISGFRSDPKAREGYQAQLQRALTLARAGKAVTLVIKDVDRFGRQGWEGLRAYGEMEDAGCRMWTVREGRFLDWPDFAQRTIQAEQESRNTSNRVRDRVHQTREDGWWFPGKVPWGYDKAAATDADKDQGAPASVLVPSPTAAGHVKTLFARRKAGEGYRRLSKWAASLPEAERGGRRLDYGNIWRLLRNPVYAGITPTGQAGRWDAIIDRATWDAVQQMNATEDQRPPKQASERYLLTGWLWCDCGARMQGARFTRGERTFTRYQCSNAMGGARHDGLHYSIASQRKMDEAVERQLSPLLNVTLTDPDWLEDLAAVWDEEVAAQQPGAQAAQELRRLRAQLAAVEARIGKLADDWRRPAEDPDRPSEVEYRTGRARMAAEYDTLSGEVARLEAAQPARVAPPISLADALARLGAKAREWGLMTTAEKRVLLQDVLLRVEPVRDQATRRVVGARVQWTVLGDGLAWLAAQQAQPEADERPSQPAT